MPTTGHLIPMAQRINYGLAGLEPRKVFREIHTIDVAPTLAAVVGTKPPSGTRGKVLVEVLEDR